MLRSVGPYVGAAWQRPARPDWLPERGRVLSPKDEELSPCAPRA
jgi:hypothetical protein